MARVNAKLILSGLLSKFEFSLVDENLYREEIKFDPKSLPIKPFVEFGVRVRRRQRT